MKNERVNDLLYNIIYTKVGNLSYMSNLVEKGLSKEGKKDYDNFIKIFTDKDSSKDLMNMKYLQLSKDIPQLLRHTLFVSYCTHVENALNDICKYYERHNGLKIKHTDLKGNGINRAKIYLEKIVGVKFPNKFNEWDKINEYIKIRNYIVHNGSIVDENDKNTNNFVESEVNISIDKDNRMIFNKGFMLEVDNDINKFFNKLWSILSHF